MCYHAWLLMLLRHICFYACVCGYLPSKSKKEGIVSPGAEAAAGSVSCLMLVLMYCWLMWELNLGPLEE